METLEHSDAQSSWGTDGLLQELLSSLIRVAPEDVPEAIETTLKRIGEKLEVDLTALVEFIPAGDSIGVTFRWDRSPVSSSDASAELRLLTTLAQSLEKGGEPIILERIPEDVPSELLGATVLADGQHLPMKSAVVIPVAIPAPFHLAFVVASTTEPRAWPAPVVDGLRLLADVLTAAWQRSRAEIALSRTHDSSDPATDPSSEHHSIKVSSVEEIVGDSPALRAALARLDEVSTSDSTVLLLGETGTGKELFAKVLHASSPRRQFPLVSINCAALPPTLIESELFGHERGAFTGAVASRQGRFELAHRGTFFLDEIGDLPLDLQAKLLRVLQEGEFVRLGTSRTRKVDVRIVAATHRDLDEAVADGTFREDLYYRLNVFPVRLPPLRERKGDIPALVWYVIKKRQRAMHRHIERVTPEVMDILQRHTWPGNIRELENVIERALIHSTDKTLVLFDDDIEKAVHSATAVTPDSTTLSSVERAHIEEVLRACGWRINGVGNAAERLGMHPNTLRFRMKKLGIVRAPAVPTRPQMPRPR